MKRTVAVLLALVMAAFAVPTAVVHAATTMTLDKSVYQSGERIEITVANSTVIGAWAGIYAVGAGQEEFGDWTWVQPGTDTYTLFAPRKPGNYEMRLHNDGTNYSDATVVATVPFTVRLDGQQGSVSVDKSQYTAGDEVQVSVKGITAEMVRSRAFVAIYRQGAPHSEWGQWRHVAEGDTVVGLRTANANGEFEVRLYSVDGMHTDETLIAKAPFTVTGAADPVASPWAKPEIAKAAERDLIPDSLRNADLTKPITRAEFAAVSVKLYERLASTKVSPASPNPFRDTNDAEVLKAKNVDITAGVADDLFAPNDLLNREQAATMLTRVFKKAYIEGWTLATDGQYNLQYTSPALFTDDGDISGWAKPSVYFMVSHGVIAGVGGNKFEPRAVTTAQQASNYAVATREQALAIALRVTENLDASKAVIGR